MTNSPINVAARLALAAIGLLACTPASRAQSFQLQPNPFFNHVTRVTMRVNAQGGEPSGANDVVNFTRFPTTIPFVQTDHIEDHDPFVGTPTGHANGDVTYTFTPTRLVINFAVNRSSPQVGCVEDPADVHVQGTIFFTVDQPVTTRFSLRYLRKQQGVNMFPAYFAHVDIAPFALNDAKNTIDEVGIANGIVNDQFNSYCHVELQAATVYGIEYSFGVTSWCNPNNLNSASISGFVALDFFQGCGLDLDNNGVVETADLLDVIAAWGPCPGPCPSYCPADASSDCVVDTEDLLAVIAAWGSGPPP